MSVVIMGNDFQKRRNINYNIFVVSLWICTFVIVSVFAVLTGYLVIKGGNVLTLTFLLDEPKSMGRAGGISIPIIGTIIVVLLALIISIPFSLVASIYLVHFEYGDSAKFIKHSLTYMSGVPAVIVGLAGFEILVVYLRLGWSILCGSIVLGALLCPTLVILSETAIRSIHYEYRLSAFALGATEWQLGLLELRIAKKNILGAILLCAARGVAETSAIMLTVGGALNYPTSILSSTRTLSLHLHLLIYEGISTRLAFGTALVLFILVSTIDLLALSLLSVYEKNDKRGEIGHV